MSKMAPTIAYAIHTVSMLKKLGNFSTNLIQKNTNKFVTIDMCIVCDPGMNIMQTILINIDKISRRDATVAYPELTLVDIAFVDVVIQTDAMESIDSPPGSSGRCSR